MTTPREVYTVHTWRFIEYRFLPASTFDTSAEAWAWVREQMDLGKDISRFRVIAGEAPILDVKEREVA